MGRWPALVFVAAICLTVLAGMETPAAGDPAWPYPIGTSDQKYDGRRFEIHIPEDVNDPKAGYSLIVLINGDVEDLSHLAVDRYIVVAPRPMGLSDTVWSAGEIKGLHALVKYLIPQLGIDKHRVHAVGMQEVQGIFGMMVFGKGSPFVSATFVETGYRGGSVSGHLKKQMAVLAFDFDGTHARGIKTIEKAMTGKVRSVELSGASGGINGDYFRYWLGVMDGRFEPGHELSFDWETEAEAAQDIPAQVKAQGKGALIYFWSPDDKDKKEAKALQNVVFFDPAVRAFRRALLPFMLKREDHPGLFEALTFKETPGVAVIDKKGKTTVLQGNIKAKALAKAMKRATK